MNVRASIGPDTAPAGVPTVAPSVPAGTGDPVGPPGTTLYLEVFINDQPAEVISTFHVDAEGGLAIEPKDLEAIGIKPNGGARDSNGRIRLSGLPGIAFQYRAATQSIFFQVGEGDRAARTLNYAGSAGVERPAAHSDFGALVNYALYGNFTSEQVLKIPAYQGVSGALDARLFSPYGTVTSTFVARAPVDGRPDLLRLDTRWSWSDPETLMTYRAGDVVSGGLPWTRPLRLGGLQVQRNFTLRPDLVTMPVPGLSGSAAVPSAVEVYAGNTKIYSDRVIGGPFQVTNLPLASGPGTARVVLTDPTGRQTVTDIAYYTSPRLLAPGLVDFSLDAGLPRTSFGLESDSYGGPFIGSGTARYGLTDTLTVEGHAEGSMSLLNGGVGAVFGLGRFGVASLSGSASGHDGRFGFQLGGSAEIALGSWRFYGSTLRSFNDYLDAASLTPPTRTKTSFLVASIKPPRAVDQVSLSIPLGFDASSVNVNFAHIVREDDRRQGLLGLSYSRALFGTTSMFLGAYKDVFDADSYSVFGGLSMPLGGIANASAGVDNGRYGTTLVADVLKSEGPEPGSHGWRVRVAEGAVTNRAVAGSYRSSIGRYEAGFQQLNRSYAGHLYAEGSVAAMGGGVFLGNRIDDAFAVVDAGMADVDVLYENRPVGRTNASGRLLVPGLRSWETNRIEIDPANLPVDAYLPTTTLAIVPANQGGVVVSLRGTNAAPAALVVFRDRKGAHLPPGSEGKLADGQEAFIVGYDGQAFIHNLEASNVVTIRRTDGMACQASFAFAPNPGMQVRIPDVVCE